MARLLRKNPVSNPVSWRLPKVVIVEPYGSTYLPKSSFLLYMLSPEWSLMHTRVDLHVTASTSICFVTWLSVWQQRAADCLRCINRLPELARGANLGRRQLDSYRQSLCTSVAVLSVVPSWWVLCLLALKIVLGAWHGYQCRKRLVLCHP